MTQDEKNRISISHQVIVNGLRLGEKTTCCHKKCKRFDRFAIFIGDSPKLSTLAYNVCPTHLALYIGKALLTRQKEVDERIQRAEKREIEKAKELLNQQ
jgi:hypothetical protein